MSVVKGDQFGTFLERAKHYSSELAASGIGAEKAANVEHAPAPDAGKDLDKILVLLVESGPVSASDLMKLAGRSAFDFSRSLNILRDAKLVTVDDVSGEETVSLTKEGNKVASLAKEAG